MREGVCQEAGAMHQTEEATAAVQQGAIYKKKIPFSDKFKYILHTSPRNSSESLNDNKSIKVVYWGIKSLCALHKLHNTN